MRDIAKEVYNKMKIGAMAWLRPVSARGDTIASFQTAHAAAQALEQEGLINIMKVERDGDGQISAIRIQRLG
jgi:hypothetical protein